MSSLPAFEYHIFKKSRAYQGHPYSGPANDNQRAEYRTFDEAHEALKRINSRNPVGFDIYRVSDGVRVF